LVDRLVVEGLRHTQAHRDSRILTTITHARTTSQRPHFDTASTIAKPPDRPKATTHRLAGQRGELVPVHRVALPVSCKELGGDDAVPGLQGARAAADHPLDRVLRVPGPAGVMGWREGLVRGGRCARAEGVPKRGAA